MPLYGYQCDTCGHHFEVRQGIKEDPLTDCPQCGSRIRRVIYPVGIVFKGSGFYVNDSRNASSSATAAGNGATDGAGGDKNEKGDKKDGAATGTAAASDKGSTVTAAAGDGAKGTGNASAGSNTGASAGTNMSNTSS